MFDFIYAKDGEAVIKSGDTDFILSGGQMLIVSSADGKTMSVTKAPFKYYSFSLASEEVKKFSEIRAFLHFSLRNLKAHIIFLIFGKQHCRGVMLTARKGVSKSLRCCRQYRRSAFKAAYA